MAESLLNTPILWINTYLQEKLAIGGVGLSSQADDDNLTNFTDSPGIGVPMFPTGPSSIDQLTQEWVVLNDERYPTAGVMATWDRMFRMRKRVFPHIKEEQVLYYFYATQDNVTPLMIQVQEKVFRLFDREDESAQEINSWAANKTINVGTQQSPINVSNRFFFHSFKVYQLEEVRDIIDFGTARTYGGNKIIIDYKYHQVDENGKVL